MSAELFRRSVIVDGSADVAFAAKRVATGGFAYAGQSCISVQRVFVHDRVARPVDQHGARSCGQ